MSPQHRDDLSRPTTALAPLTAPQLSALSHACETADGVAPFGEQTFLDLRAGAGRQLAVQIEDQTVAAVHVGADTRWAELAVHPAHRRRGLGAALLSRLLREHPGARVWAHGDLEPAQALAHLSGLRPTRRLLHMTLPGPSLAQLAALPLPEGYTARAFTDADAPAWLAVNARAFASHPEQGRVDAQALAERRAEDWYRDEDFLLVERVLGSGPATLVGFHWTKVEAATGTGEVYVLGIDPAFQGQGLGAPLTRWGLVHLRERGCREVGLYVEGDNAPALATYRGLGFGEDAVDVMYEAEAAPATR